jgi:tetratricopeptide (TPR) repeat protein
MLDSVEANKIQYLKSIAQVYESRKNFSNAAEWYAKILKVKKNPGKVDLYNAGYSYYRAALLDSALAYFNIYAQKYPDDIFGYFMTGKTSWAIDSTMSLGLANPALEKAIQIGLTDTVKFKSQLIYSYKYFVAYYATIKKDKNLAITFNEKILSLDPADAEANSNRSILSGGKQPAGNKITETKQQTSGSKSAEGIKKPIPVSNSNEVNKKN